MSLNPYLGHSRFFLGSDSAPHPPHAKATSTPTHACAAGIYTSPILLPLVAHILESFGALDKLEDFVSRFGRAFYKRPLSDPLSKVILSRPKESKALIAHQYVLDDATVVPFWAGRELGWEI